MSRTPREHQAGEEDSSFSRSVICESSVIESRDEIALERKIEYLESMIAQVQTNSGELQREYFRALDQAHELHHMKSRQKIYHLERECQTLQSKLEATLGNQRFLEQKLADSEKRRLELEKQNKDMQAQMQENTELSVKSPYPSPFTKLYGLHQPLSLPKMTKPHHEECERFILSCLR